MPNRRAKPAEATTDRRVSHRLPIERDVRYTEIAVSWPAELDHAIPLKLVATGVLVRAEEKQAALSIQRYEFRTRGLSL
jgi:hypothetical protein